MTARDFDRITSGEHLRAVVVASLLLVAFMVGLSGTASAQSPTTAVKICSENTGSDGHYIQACGSSVATAISALAAAISSYYGVRVDTCGIGAQGGHIQGNAVGDPVFCDPVNSPFRDATSQSVTTCPGNSVLTGNACACPSSTAWRADLNQCMTDTAFCAGGAGSVAHGEGDPQTPTICHNGCTVRVDMSGCLSGGANCGWTGTYTKNPTPCSQPNLVNTTGTSSCADGQCPASINGQTICLTCGKAGTTPTTKVNNEVVKPDGSRSTQNVVTRCNGSVCTTTTTTNGFDANGNPTTTETATETKVDDKVKNECDDATGAAGLIKCAQLGTPGNAGPIGSATVGPSSVVPVGGFPAGSCPADIPLPLGMSFSFSGICRAGDALRPIVLTMAWLSAGLIVFGGLKRG